MAGGPKFPRDEEVTLVTCRACGGNWEITSETAAGYKMVQCRWCVRGAMTPMQAVEWTAREARRRSQPKK